METQPTWPTSNGWSGEASAPRQLAILTSPVFGHGTTDMIEGEYAAT